MDLLLSTERLLLRPLDPRDAPALQRHCGNWKVARMLARVPHPYPDGLAERWIGEQPRLRAEGLAHCFAVEQDGALIGTVGLERREAPHFELGYWLGEPWWGRGLATEAAGRAVAFAFETLAAERLASGHFVDNPASGRVLEKCGFAELGTTRRWCEARGRELPHRDMLRLRGSHVGAADGAGTA